jgi:predicted permease
MPVTKSVAMDVRYAWRSLRRTPGFTLVAVLTFALGIGATTAIFSAVYAVVLQPFPFPEPDRVVAIGERWSGGNGLAAVSAGNFNDWRTNGRFFTDLAARRFVSVNVAGSDAPERVVGNAVTSTYFSVFRIAPARGRVFTTTEDQPGRDDVVVLADRLWRRMFAADPAVVGRRIRMDGRLYTVIGVMPRAFDSVSPGDEQFWIPAAFTAEQLASHDGHSMTVAARLAPGVSLAQVASELKFIFARISAQTPDKQVRQGVAIGYASEIIGDSRQRLLVLFGAVALVLLLACSNVAHLLLARGRARSHEVALRASLGASSARLVRQFLVESLVLAGIGGVVGIGTAHVAVPALVALSPAGVPRLEQSAVDVPVFLFALMASIISAVIAGIAPAIHSARPDLRTELASGARTLATGGDAQRGLLVATQVALSIVLLTGAGRSCEAPSICSR